MKIRGERVDMPSGTLIMTMVRYDEALKHFSNAVSRAGEVRGSQTIWATLYLNQAHAYRKTG